MPAALAVDWEAGRKALAAGVPMQQVADSLGIQFRALQKRAQRGKWFIPGPALKRLQKNQAQASQAIRDQQAAAVKQGGLQNTRNHHLRQYH